MSGPEPAMGGPVRWISAVLDLPPERFDADVALLDQVCLDIPADRYDPGSGR